jgi:hypothetical protein
MLQKRENKKGRSFPLSPERKDFSPMPPCVGWLTSIGNNGNTGSSVRRDSRSSAPPSAGGISTLERLSWLWFYPWGLSPFSRIVLKLAGTIPTAIPPMVQAGNKSLGLFSSLLRLAFIVEMSIRKEKTTIFEKNRARWAGN